MSTRDRAGATRGIIVILTKAQIKAIKPAWEQMAAASAEGNPGILVAQVYDDHMRVGFFDSERAQRFLGADPKSAHSTAWNYRGPEDCEPDDSATPEE